MTSFLSAAALAASASAAGVAAALATFTPRSSLWCGVVWHGDRAGSPRVALTFDDGPSPEHTPAILDVLGEFNAPGAFFVVGRNAVCFPALLRRIEAEGHLIGNHSFDHDHMGVMRGLGYWEAQLARTDEVIGAETGRRALMFRPPMGFKTPFMAVAARQRGQRLVTWSRRAFDGLPTTDTRILRRLDGRTRPGDIIALHDGVEPHGFRRDDATVRALRSYLRLLQEQGLQPVRLDTLTGLTPYADPSRAAAAPCL